MIYQKNYLQILTFLLMTGPCFLLSIIEEPLLALKLNNDLGKVNRSVFQWKMNISSGPKNKHRKSFLFGNLKQYRIPTSI